VKKVGARLTRGETALFVFGGIVKMTDVKKKEHFPPLRCFIYMMGVEAVQHD